MDYEAFIKGKHLRHQATGFDPVVPLPSKAFDWQQRVITWLTQKGRAGVFAECGLGKSLMELAWSEQVVRKTNQPVLILTPLTVGPQMLREAEKFEIGVPVHLIRDQPARWESAIYIINYESMHKLDLSAFVGVSADEGSILKSYTGKRKQQLCSEFRHTPFKLSATATPAPNDHMELGNQAEFLGVMRSSEMLSRWFINDTMKAGGYRLCNHAKEDFWRWMASFSVCISKPSDVGGSDEGYDLPEMKLHWHSVDTNTMPAGQLILVNPMSIPASTHGSPNLRKCKASESGSDTPSRSGGTLAKLTS